MTVQSVAVQLMRVAVVAPDDLSRAGVLSQLRDHPQLRVVPQVGPDVHVAVVVADVADERTVRLVQELRARGCPRVVVVAGRLEDGVLLALVEAGVCGLLRRADVTAEGLTAAVVAAAEGDGTLPADLLGRLLGQVRRLGQQVLAPRGLNVSGLTDREREVLVLLADGADTTGIAHQLCYSERTVKNVIHDLTTRLGVRNRTHAVAYALREGLIP